MKPNRNMYIYVIKWIQYYTVGTISKSNIKIVEWGKSTLIAQNCIAGDFQANMTSLVTTNVVRSTCKGRMFANPFDVDSNWKTTSCIYLITWNRPGYIQYVDEIVRTPQKLFLKCCLPTFKETKRWHQIFLKVHLLAKIK